MRSLLSFFTLLLTFACLPQVGEPLDAGGSMTTDDGGTLGGGAGGGGGASSCGNAAQDGDESDVDCGGSCPSCPDSRTCRDARDCTSGRCSGGTCAAAANACGASFAGCTTFTDLTTTVTPTVRFPMGGNRYSPSCLRIRFGQVVRFEGSFSSHTLLQSCGPVNNQLQASTGQSLDVTLSGLGLYGFYCLQHGAPSGSGMAGAIEVVR